MSNLVSPDRAGLFVLIFNGGLQIYRPTWIFQQTDDTWLFRAMHFHAVYLVGDTLCTGRTLVLSRLTDLLFQTDVAGLARVRAPNRLAPRLEQ